MDKQEYIYSEDLIRQVVALLRSQPLSVTDPNDTEALTVCVQAAAIMDEVYQLKLEQPEDIVPLALAAEMWGHKMGLEPWVTKILCDLEEDGKERVSELYRARAFEDVGPEAIDFPVHCILKYKSRNPDTEYENADIHGASVMGLEIAQKYNITDLSYTFHCVEMLLLIGTDYTQEPECSPIINFLKDDSLSAADKVNQCYTWIYENIETVD